MNFKKAKRKLRIRTTNTKVLHLVDEVKGDRGSSDEWRQWSDDLSR